MPRKILFRTPDFPYHVTARANNRDAFPVRAAKMWQIISSECHAISLLFGTKLHAVLMMPNHIHMLISTPVEDLGIVMNEFMAATTRRANLLSSRSGHLYGGPYNWTVIHSSLYFAHALKYVYRNPVRAKLCDNVEDYPFSSLHSLLGQSPLGFPIAMTNSILDVSLPSSEPADWLEWLNQPFPTEADELLRKALRKKRLHNIINPHNRRIDDRFNRLI
jgi:putative transposase